MNLTKKLCSQFGLAFLACNAFGQKPNIIYILADDLGYNEISANGQTRFKTPNIDNLAQQGISFTRHYSGSPVSAPSRCVLLTGLHTGHSCIRDNAEVGAWNDFTGQLPIPDSSFTIAEMLKANGYKTACIGKWGLGFIDNQGSPLKQGFDYFFGYLCQRQAHNYYPQYLWKNNEKVQLNNPPVPLNEKIVGAPNDSLLYKKYIGTVYSQQLIADEAIQYIRDNKKNSFFLFFTPTIPHLALQAPSDAVAPFVNSYNDKPYVGGKGYAPNQHPRATYVSMISLLDKYVGMIMDELKKQGLDKNTIIMFSSDNGATFSTGGADTKYFESNNPFRGYKTDVYDGGIHVPFIVSWQKKIKKGATSDLLCGFQDIMPTLADIANIKAPTNIDGISMLPSLIGKGKQRKHEYLYWEYHSQGGAQAVIINNWKAVKRKISSNPTAKIELYNLTDDIGESKDIATEHPDVIEKVKFIMQSRTPSPLKEWNFKAKMP